jgi:serine protease Do
LAANTLAQEEHCQREEFYAATEHFEKLSTLFRQNAEMASPAIVNIRVTRSNHTVGRTRTSEDAGSGIISVIAQKHVILTNRHVIEEAERGKIEILTHDRRLLTPVRIASNEEFDIAIIEIAEELPQLVRFGDSDRVHVGEIVLAIGNPFGLDRSLSMGVISAVGRRHMPGANGGTAPRTDFLQTDATVNPGSSGGMLLNLRGEIIGVITAIATKGGVNEGVAFVMPINTVLRIAEQLVQTGTVMKPYIGFNFNTDFSHEERLRVGIDRVVGARINRIMQDSPAEHSGLSIGDVILMFNNTEVEDWLHVFHLVARSEVGKPVNLRINRGGEILDIAVTPIERLSR